MARHNCANLNWSIPDSSVSVDLAQLAVLMDVRDQVQQQTQLLQSINTKLSCHRIPRALDAIWEVGKDIRRKQKAARTKRRNAKERA